MECIASLGKFYVSTQRHKCLRLILLQNCHFGGCWATSIQWITGGKTHQEVLTVATSIWCTHTNRESLQFCQDGMKCSSTGVPSMSMNCQQSMVLGKDEMWHSRQCVLDSQRQYPGFESEWQCLSFYHFTRQTSNIRNA